MPNTQTKDLAETGARERKAIFARCERFLAGHGPLRPRAALAELAKATTSDEERDFYGEGAIIEDFEREVAELLGKEAAVFLPSGTMAQQIALRVWAERKNCFTVAFHPTCHLELHEQHGYARLHGLSARLVGHARRLLTLADLEQIAEPIAALLLELPQREIGGFLPTWDELEAQVAWAQTRNIALHLDGARLWESAPFYGRSYAEIAALFDSVYVSFYKGVGAIAGAALAGPRDVIAEAHVWQRRHGGNLISLFPYVISARTKLRERLPKFACYHERALRVAAVLSSVPGVAVAPNPPHAHMMHVYLRSDADKLVAESVRIAREERVGLFQTLQPTEVPGVAKFELSLGDAVEALTDDEIGTYFQRVMGV
jgi:threonine aldolase